MTTTTFEDWERRKMQDPAFRAAAQAQEPEYLQACCKMYRKRITELEAEVERLRGAAQVLSERNRWHVHDVDMLRAENKRLQALVGVRNQRIITLEAEVKQLRAIEHIGRRRIGKNLSRPDVYHAAGQDTNHQLCLALIALDEWRAAVDVIGKDKVGRDDECR